MPNKFTNLSAVIAIWIVTAIAILAICKVAEIQLPIFAKLPNWEWLEVMVKLCGLLFG